MVSSVIATVLADRFQMPRMVSEWIGLEAAGRDDRYRLTFSLNVLSCQVCATVRIVSLHVIKSPTD